MLADCELLPNARSYISMPSVNAHMIEMAANALEKTSSPALRREAENFLLQLRGMPKPYELCKQVLAQSNLPAAQFHAAAAIKAAISREWTLVDKAESSTLRDELLLFSVNKTGLVPFVLRAILDTVATITKLAFQMQADQLTRVLNVQISQLLAAEAPKKDIALNFCLMLIKEFSSTQSSGVGRNLQWHLICHDLFEKKLLASIFQAALGLVESYAADKTLLSSSTLMLALQVMDTTLSWTFIGQELTQGNEMTNALRLLEKPTDEQIKISPGPTWTQVLVLSNLVDVVCCVYKKHRIDQDEDGPCVLLRRLLLHLASVEGSVFPSPQVRQQYVSRYIRMVVNLLMSPSSEADPVLEQLDTAIILRRLVANFTVEVLGAIPDECRLLLQGLAQLTCAAMPNTPGDDVMQEQVLDDCFTTWRLLTTQSTPSQKAMKQLVTAKTFTSLLQEFVFGVYQTYIKWRLHLRPPLKDKGDTLGQLERQLNDVGIVGRFASAQTLHFLLNTLNERAKVLVQGSLAQEKLDVLLVEVMWLFKLMCYSTCDVKEGEAEDRPLIPTEILEVTVSPAGAQLVNGLFASAIGVIDFENQWMRSNPGKFLSPDFCRTTVWWLGNFVRTYIVPVTLGKNMWKLFGADVTKYLAVIDFVLNKVNLNLATCRNNDAILDASVELLLHITAYRPDIYPKLLQTQAWWNLVHTFCSDIPPLKDDSVVAIFYIMVLVSAGGTEDEMCKQGASEAHSKLMKLVSTRMTNILAAPGLRQMSFAVVTELDMVVKLLQGWSRCESAPAYKLGLQFLEGKCLPVLIQMVGELEMSSSMIVGVLEVFSNVSTYHVSWMAEPELRAYSTMIMGLLNAWTGYNKARVQRNQAAGQEARKTIEEQVDEVACLLKIIVGFLCKEAVDKSHSTFTQQDFPSEFTLLALNKLLPNFSTELLQYPDICEGYFDTIEVIIMLHPEKFAAMDASARLTMIESAKYACKCNSNIDVVKAGLKIVQNISMFHLRARRPGSQIMSPFDEEVNQFQQLILQIVIFEPLNSALMEPAVDALLPLCVVEPVGYLNNIHTLMQKMSAQSQGRINSEFNDHFLILKSSNMLLDKSVQLNFKNGLPAFLQTLRTLVSYN